jgi:hypothetical protein
MTQKSDDAVVTTNEELVKRAKTDDQFAITELFDLYSPTVAFYLRSAIADEGLVANMLKETFEQAQREISKLDDATQIDLWLLAIATRVVGKHLQDRQRPMNELDTPRDTSILRIQITSEPLTARDLSIVIPAITNLYTRCWLIQQNRFADLIDYVQTRDSRFSKEADLQVGLIAHNSPATIDFIVNAGKIIGGAADLGAILKNMIDAIIQTGLRYEEFKQRKEWQSQYQQLALQDKELELERKRMLIENEKQALKFRNKIMRELVGAAISPLHSTTSTDATQKEMLIQTVIPSLLQIASVNGVTAVLPSGRQSEEDKGLSEKK